MKQRLAYQKRQKSIPKKARCFCVSIIAKKQEHGLQNRSQDPSMASVCSRHCLSQMEIVTSLCDE